MPGRTVQTTGGHAVMRDLQAAAAMTTTTRGTGLGHLLEGVRGIAIETAIKIEIEVEAGSKIAIEIISNGLTGAEAEQQKQESMTKA